MKKLFAFGLVALVLGIVPMATGACGGSGGSSSGSGGGSSTSGQNCSSSHLCVNGSCNCGTDGKGQSCTDNTKCEAECKVCM